MAYESEFDEAWGYGKKIVLWFIGLCIILSLVGWGLGWFTKVVNPDTAISNYEEFQEIYNTCSKINTDLGTIRAVDANDRMFDSFSKQAMIAQKRQQMSRWVEDYNAKSKMWNRALWKSSTLPYQLQVTDFNNYDERTQ